MKISHRGEVVLIGGDIDSSEGCEALAISLKGKATPTRLDSSGIRAGSSSGLHYYLQELKKHVAGPIVHVNMSTFFYSQFSLSFSLLRQADTIESMHLRLMATDGSILDEVFTVGKEIPLLSTYDGFDLTKTVNGKTFTLDSVPEEILAILTQIHARQGAIK